MTDRTNFLLFMGQKFGKPKIMCKDFSIRVSLVINVESNTETNTTKQRHVGVMVEVSPNLTRDV